jgi:hypothetical protein
MQPECKGRQPTHPLGEAVPCLCGVGVDEARRGWIAAGSQLQMTCGFVIDRGLECKAIPKLLHLTSPSFSSLALLLTSLSYTSLKLRHPRLYFIADRERPRGPEMSRPADSLLRPLNGDSLSRQCTRLMRSATSRPLEGAKISVPTLASRVRVPMMSPDLGS